MKKIHRFMGNFGIDAERLLLRDAEIVHQVRDVLKLRVGELIALSDGMGEETAYRIEASAKSGIELSAVERRKCAEPEKEVTLYCAILKRENFEYAVEKAVECGVKRIVPVVSARTVKLGTKPERLAKIAKEAAEQSGRGFIPAISSPMRFADAIKDSRKNDETVFFDASGEEFSRAKPLSGTIGVWIGPEGGWEDFELDAARLNRFALLSLGKRVLKAETAVTVAVFLAAR